MATSRKDIETIPDPKHPTSIEASRPLVEQQLTEQGEQLPPGRSVPEQIPPLHHESLIERLQHATKSAFTSAEETIMGGARSVGQALGDSIEAAETKFKSATSLASEKMDAAKQSAKEQAVETKESAKDKASEIKESAKEQTSSLSAAAQQKAHEARQAAETVAEKAKEAAGRTGGELKAKAEAVKQSAEQKAADIKDSVESGAISAKFATAEMAERTGRQLGKAGDKVKGALASLASGAEREAAESLETTQRSIDEELAETAAAPPPPPTPTAEEATAADPRKRTEAEKLLGVSR